MAGTTARRSPLQIGFPFRYRFRFRFRVPGKVFFRLSAPKSYLHPLNSPPSLPPRSLFAPPPPRNLMGRASFSYPK